MIPPIWLLLQACIRPETPGPVELTTLGQAFEDHRRDVEWNHRPLVPGLGGAWQARAGRVRAYFVSDTTWIVDRAARDPQWKVGLTATALGRADRLRVLGGGTSHAEGPWYERVRDGVVEWFHARPEGLEHGFTVLDRPPGDGPMVLEITVDGASPVALPDGARFVSGGATRLDWRGLVVTDAERRRLATTVTASGATLRLTVDDADARWPVSIDPLLTVPGTRRPVTGGPDSPNWAGFSIDSDGEQLVLGNPGDPSATSGAAIVLERNEGADDLWGEVDALTGLGEARIGYTVAIDGPTVALASPPAGTAHIYRNDGGGWVEEGYVAPVGNIGFGTSMDLDNETLVVGAPAAASGGIDAGEVRVYNRYLGWGEVAILPGDPSWKLGSAVSLSGDGFVAGAPGGLRAIVFRMNAAGLPEPGRVAILGEPAAGFGKAVAMDGGRIAVGAPGAGRVFLYRLEVRTPTAETWVSEGFVDRPGATAFGSAVALWGDTLAVTDLPSPGTAQVHLFELRGGAWSYVESFVAGQTSTAVPVPVTLGASVLAVGLAEDPDASFQIWRRSGDQWLAEDTNVGWWNVGSGAKLGMAAAATGDRVVVGAPGDDDLGPDTGAIATYVRDDHGSWAYLGDEYGDAAGERFGSTVAVDGDLTIVGAPDAETSTSVAAGRVELLSWDGALHSPLAEFLPEAYVPSTDWNALGWGEAVAIDQLFAVVGAPGRNTRGGAAFVFGRNVGGVADSWALYAADVAAGLSNEQMGQSLALAGGTALVGSPDCDPLAGANAGCVEIYDLDDLSLLQTLEGSAAGNRFGRSVTVEGRLMAVGAPGYDGDIGEARVYELGIAAAPVWDEIAQIAPAVADPDEFGHRLALSGDQLYVSTRFGDAVEVHSRNFPAADAWSRSEVLTGTAPGSRFGESLAAARDTVIIGEPWLVAPPEDGRVHLLQRDAAHPPVVGDDTFPATEDTPLVVSAPGFLANDYDPDGDVLVVIYESGPSNGTLSPLGPDGSFTYTPEGNFDGDDSFDYSVSDGVQVVRGTVTVTVAGTNDDPVALPDGPYTTEEDTPLFELAPGVLTNDDDDLDGLVAPFAVDVTVPPLTGFILAPDGGFSYLPPTDLVGTVFFDYVAADLQGGSSETIRVFIEVTEANDPPVGPGQLPDYVGLLEDTTFVVPPPGLIDPAFGISDPEGDVLEPRITDPPRHGTLVVDSLGGWRYRPDPDSDEDDDFSYEVFDDDESSGRIDVYLVVDPVNDLPVARDDGLYAIEEDAALTIGPDVLLANDTDVEPGSLTLRLNGAPAPAHGTVTLVMPEYEVVYTPDPDWAGDDTFGYIAEDGDGGASQVALVAVRVVAVNDRPVAQDDDLGEVSAPTVGAVLDNDRDADQDPLTLTTQLASVPLGGSVTFGSDGGYTYTPHPDFVGADSFTYVATDAEGASSNAATVRVVVIPGDVPTPPTTTTDDTGCARSAWFHDGDGDGFGDDATAAEACAAPDRHVDRAGDCDDQRADIHPGAAETADDGLDQDCDGLDNLARPVGACDSSGGAGGVLALGMAVLLLRRRGDR